MLETILIDQGIIQSQRLSLLCVPDYLFFRTHSHRLYREFKGIPRYSIITRKVTDQLDTALHYDHACSLKTLFIVDGSTALTNAPFYFQLAKQLDLSIVGTNLDINELPKLRYTPTKSMNFQKFEPLTIVSSEVHYHAPLHESGLENNAITLPPTFNLFTQPITITQNTIAIGSVKNINDFFPINFDLMRINLGDFVEYNQRFPKTSGSNDNTKKSRKQAILEGINRIINVFNISVILISLYKLSKFFASSTDPIKHQVQDICDNWNFSEAMLINNEKRRVWEKEPMENLKDLFDAQGYIVIFNQERRPKTVSQVKY
ncbi:MAG: hypothetical protein ACFFB5_04395 [Promethearchaeota archaeon]